MPSKQSSSIARTFLLWGVSLALVCTSCDAQPPPLCGVAPGQADRDDDGFADTCDTCPDVASLDNHDSDSDGDGDACDPDIDGDGVPNAQDTCPGFVSSGNDRADGDADGVADLCDACPDGGDKLDTDDDGVSDCQDVCPMVPDTNQLDTDGDGVGDACDTCPGQPNAYITECPPQAPPSTPGQGDTLEWTLDSIHAELTAGRTTCEAIVQGHIDRILSHDLSTEREAALNAFTVLNQGALERARALDASMAHTGELTGSLHCMPLVLKDIYAVQGLGLSSGILGLEGVRATGTGTLVRAMEQQGAVVLGLTAMDELSRGVYGISSRSGRVGNAYDPRRSPGGSSSGSAVAVSAGFAVAGMGSENCGSLTLPAAYNGLVTLKPTRGYLSMSGIFPSNYVDAVPGPMTRTVGDLARVLDAVAGPDADDPRTDGVVRPASFVSQLSPDALQGKRIGVLRRYASQTQDTPEHPWEGAGAGGHRVYHDTIGRLRRLGATVIENVTLPELDTDRSSGSTPSMIRAFMPRWTDHSHAIIEQACDQQRYMKSSFDSPALCDAWISKIPGLGTSVYHDYLETRGIERHAYLRGVMDALRLDALLVPADAKGAVGRGYGADTPCRILSVTGIPSMVFLAGYEGDFPVGMMLLGRRSDDPTLVGMAYAYEQSVGPRRPPELGPAQPEQPLGQGVDASAFNALRLKIARRAWRDVLKDEERWALDWRTFAKIVQDARE